MYAAALVTQSSQLLMGVGLVFCLRAVHECSTVLGTASIAATRIKQEGLASL